MLQLLAGVEGTSPDFNSMGCHSEVLLHASEMPKVAGEGGVAILLGPILM